MRANAQVHLHAKPYTTTLYVSLAFRGGFLLICSSSECDVEVQSPCRAWNITSPCELIATLGMAMLQNAIRRAAASALRPSSTCSSSAFSARFESTDAIVQRAKENEGNVITEQGAAFLGDLRSTSGLGIGDGIENHTEKWLEVLAVQCWLRICQEEHSGDVRMRL